MGLPVLPAGMEWVLFTVPISPSTTWTMYARYHPTSQFDENVAYMEHMLIAGAAFCFVEYPATVRLNDFVFNLHLRHGLHGEPATHCMQLPLERASSQRRPTEPGSFLTLPSLSWANVESAYAAGRARIA